MWTSQQRKLTKTVSRQGTRQRNTEGSKNGVETGSRHRERAKRVSRQDTRQQTTGGNDAVSRNCRGREKLKHEPRQEKLGDDEVWCIFF
jgi:hypothetical protein